MHGQMDLYPLLAYSNCLSFCCLSWARVLFLHFSPCPIFLHRHMPSILKCFFFCSVFYLMQTSYTSVLSVFPNELCFSFS